MDLTLSGEIAKHLLTMTKKDTKLAIALAQQFLEIIDPTAMAHYLLTTDVAKNLLAEKIKNAPEETLRMLQRLPITEAGVKKGPGRRGARLGRKATIAQAATATGTGRRKRRKRQRLTSEEIEHIKEQVRSFLRRYAWSTRKQITNHVSFPSVAAYNRIMAELRDEKDVISQGEKSKTLYALKGASGASKAGKNKNSKGKSAKKAVAKRGPAKRAKKIAAAPKRAIKKRTPLLCPFPGCTNKAAPVFGMMCKEHKDISQEEREKYFAERRQSHQEQPQ